MRPMGTSDRFTREIDVENFISCLSLGECYQFLNLEVVFGIYGIFRNTYHGLMSVQIEHPKVYAVFRKWKTYKISLCYLCGF